MRFPKIFFTLLSRHFSTATITTKAIAKFPILPTFRAKYRPRVIKEAQKVLTEYLQTTSSLPFIFADHIARNSLFSLSALIRRVPFSSPAFSIPAFSEAFQNLLRYEPINEFEFFFESIGIDYQYVSKFSPPGKLFFSEDGAVLEVARELSGFGFPWNKLGLLYKEEISIFSKSSRELNARLNGFRECYGFGNTPLVGVCLAFPYLLSKEGELGSYFDALFDDLQRVLVEFDMDNCVEGNVDAWYEVCCKVRVFYELDCEKGKVGEVMCRKKELFLECPKEVLVQKVEYFSKLSVRKDDVGLLLLENPEILSLDLETPIVSVFRLLKHFGMHKKDLRDVGERYPHVLGRNRLANVPCVMRALDLNEWFFNTIKSSNNLLATYAVSCHEEEMDEEFVDALKRMESGGYASCRMSKLDFLKGIGFGENALTIKALNKLHGSSHDLQMKYSKICSLIRIEPNAFSQRTEVLEQKVNFLCQDMGSSLDYLETFPQFLYFDLENWIKCRYRVCAWLRERGLRGRTKNYSIASMMATSEKRFMERLSSIHPDAPKLYLECKRTKKE